MIFFRRKSWDKSKYIHIMSKVFHSILLVFGWRHCPLIGPLGKFSFETFTPKVPGNPKSNRKIPNCNLDFIGNSKRVKSQKLLNGNKSIKYSKLQFDTIPLRIGQYTYYRYFLVQ